MQTRMKNPRASFVKFLLASCWLAGLGCGGSDKIVMVAGRVTHNNQPVPGLVIAFVPQTETDLGVSTGKTNESGHYDLVNAKTGGRGAVLGPHKVWVSLPTDSLGPLSEEEKKRQSTMKFRRGREKPSAEMEKILRKYGSVDRTPLTVEVKAGEQIDLQLD